MKALSNAGWQYGLDSLDERVTTLEQSGGSGSAVTSVNGDTGDVTITAVDLLPAIPTTGTFVLTATDGVLSWEVSA